MRFWGTFDFSFVRCSSYTVSKRLEHDSQAFTQGLEFDADGLLVEGTGLYGKSQLRRVRINDTTSTSPSVHVVVTGGCVHDGVLRAYRYDCVNSAHCPQQ